MPGKCAIHGMVACSRCVVIESAAERIAGTVNFMILTREWGELVSSCMAFRLDDGTTDGTFYPTRRVALRYQLRPSLIFYFRNSPGGVSSRDCQIFLNMHREAFANDRIAWTDPDSPDLIISDPSAQHMRRNPI